MEINWVTQSLSLTPRKKAMANHSESVGKNPHKVIHMVARVRTDVKALSTHKYINILYYGMPETNFPFIFVVPSYTNCIEN